MVGIPAAACAALYRGGIAAGLGWRRATAVAGIAGIAWDGWIGMAAWLARSGAFRQDPTSFRPWIGFALVVALASMLVATRIPVVSRVLAVPGMPARLMLPQTFRVIGAVFLVVLGLGALPAVFAVPAGVGDVLVGVSAPWAVRRLARGRGRRAALWFNALASPTWSSRSASVFLLDWGRLVRSR